jgi:hypothetical protein
MLAGDPFRKTPPEEPQPETAASADPIKQKKEKNGAEGKY